MRERVVVTGMGAVSPFGVGRRILWDSLLAGSCALSSLPENGKPDEFSCLVAGLVPAFDFTVIPRQNRRAMSKMACLAWLAAGEALAEAGLSKSPPGDMGVYLGTTMGSPLAMVDFFSKYLGEGDLGSVRSTEIFKIMGHGLAASLAQAFNLTGRTVAPSAACAAGLQAVGLGFEAIASGREKILICGGAEEFDLLTARTFNHIQAASHNPEPALACKPFDRDRDGLVCAEGAGILVIESRTLALKRGAKILAEILGFATNTSVSSLVFPETGVLADCMRKALNDAGLSPGDIDGVNAHATATLEGDLAEARAIFDVFGDSVPVNSLKGNLGHTMAASGALELIADIVMMKEGLFLPTYNLTNIGPDFPILKLPVSLKIGPINTILKNSFALGGVNASLIVGLVKD